MKNISVGGGFPVPHQQVDHRPHQVDSHKLEEKVKNIIYVFVSGGSWLVSYSDLRTRRQNSELPVHIYQGAMMEDLPKMVNLPSWG